MELSARVTGLEILNWNNFQEPVTRALKTSLSQAVYGLQRDIATSLKSNFFIPGDPNKQSLIYLGGKAKTYSAQLSYSYKAIPLSMYPVKQYRITTGNSILRVGRGGKFKANQFQRRVVARAAIATYTQIRRRGGMKLVEGKLGFKGWLHTGRRAKETGYYGQTNTFAAQIFERNQQETWSGGHRLPIHRLFGPSVMELVMYPETQKAILASKHWQDLETILYRNLKL